MVGWGGSPRSAAPASPKNRWACATFLGLCLARCSVSDPEPLLLPLARRPPGGTTNPSKKLSSLEGFVVPGWGRLGAAGPISIVRPPSGSVRGVRIARDDLVDVDHHQRQDHLPHVNLVWVR